jgi:hypothetical protein
LIDHSCRNEVQRRVCKPVFGTRFLPKVASFKKMLAAKGLLIGTIRGEYLDRVFLWNAVDPARKLETFRDYYDGHRMHRALAGSTAAQRAGALRPAPAELDDYGWQRHCRGLFELPIAA